MGGRPRDFETEEALMKEWAAIDEPVRMTFNQDDVDSMFDKPEPKKEPFIEDILASFRRIMSEAADDPEPLDSGMACEWEAMLGTGGPMVGDDPEPKENTFERPVCPKCGSDRVLCQCEIDSLLGFGNQEEDPSLTDRLIKMRTDKKLRKESMPFWGFLSDLSMGMTAIRDSWPKNWKKTGLWMNEDGRLILNGEEWQPTQDDLLAEDWQIGD